MTNVNDIETLFRCNYTPLVTLAVRMVHDQEVARDIVHDVFASLLTSMPADVSIGYLAVRVRYLCLNHLRSLTVKERFVRLTTLDEQDDGWPDEEDIARLNTIVSLQLSDRTQSVVRLRFTDGKTYSEIAETLGISEAAVYKHLSHAMKVLRKNFQDQ